MSASPSCDDAPRLQRLHRCRGAAIHSRARAGYGFAASIVTAGLLVASATAWSQPQSFSIDTGFRGQTTYTTNAGYEASGAEESDLIVEVAPFISVRGGGARLRASGTLELVGLVYANGTQRDRVLPNGSLTATLEAIERRLFIDAGVTTRQDQVDPFGVRPEGPSTVNTRTSLQYRLSPYLQGQFGPDVRYLLRSDNTYTETRPRETASAETEGYFARHLAEVEQRPRRLGWRLGYERTERQLRGDFAPKETVDIGRVAVLLQLGEQINIGVRYGRESNNFTFADQQDNSFVGVEVDWRPTERTRLRGYAEDRFFGTGWSASFSHRMPWLAWDIATERGLSSSQQVLLGAPAGANVASLLGDLLTTRFPDPAQRDAVVQDLIQRGRLPASFLRDTNIYTEQLSVASSLRATIALVGIRHSFALSGYRSRTEDLGSRGLAPVLGITAALTNNEQKGASATYSLLVTPFSAVSLTGTWRQTRGLGAFSGDETKQSAGTVQWTHRAGPRTSLSAGVRHQVIDSNVTTDADESAVFAGMTHRF